MAGKCNGSCDDGGGHCRCGKYSGSGCVVPFVLILGGMLGGMIGFGKLLIYLA
jgi:uncharacterized membrane protein